MDPWSELCWTSSVVWVNGVARASGDDAEKVDV